MRLVHKFLPLLIVPFCGATLVAQSATAAPYDRAVTAADRRCQRLGRQRLDAGVLRAGPADDRSRPGALLWWFSAQEKRAGHHDAVVRHDGADHRAMGDHRLQPVLCLGQQLYWRTWSMPFCARWALHPMPTTPATIPQQTFMIYQLMFAIITPALICGAFAERMKFSAMLLFMALWSLLVYAPMAHMVWGKGGLLNASLGGRFPTLDFAGGTVVHITSGCRRWFAHFSGTSSRIIRKEPMPPHSVVLSFIGACLLWVGWFGFNAGSALSAGSLATSAFVATHLRQRLRLSDGQGPNGSVMASPACLGAISGSVAGLVAITPLRDLWDRCLHC